MNADHYLVVDFEATCSDDNAFSRHEMEIIEFGAVMVSAATLQQVSEFQSFVKPVRNPQLTEFCKNLTNIPQSDVDAAIGFRQVLSEFTDWADRSGSFVFCSWGEYDRKQLQRDCDYHDVPYPFDDRHINLKAEFASTRKRRRMGVSAALGSVGLSFTGSHHRGIDDARNIARLLPYILEGDSAGPD
jgi:inhibitor of KinA sporulation pathway (predicted exonuclease)